MTARKFDLDKFVAKATAKMEQWNEDKIVDPNRLHDRTFYPVPAEVIAEMQRVLRIIPLDNPLIRWLTDFYADDESIETNYRFRDGSTLDLHVSRWNGKDSVMAMRMHYGADLEGSSTSAAVDGFGQDLGIIGEFLRQHLQPRLLETPALNMDDDPKAAAVSAAADDRNWKKATDLLWTEGEDYVKIANARFASAGGRSFLHRVADAPDESPEVLEFARRLLHDGGDLQAVSHNGYTPLHLAALNGHVQLAALFAEGMALDTAAKAPGAKPPIIAGALDTPDQSGATALHHAAAGGHHVIVQELKDLGADPAIRTRAGETALDLALKGIPDRSRMPAMADEAFAAFIKRRKSKFMVAWLLDWDCPDKRFHYEAVQRHFQEDGGGD